MITAKRRHHEMEEPVQMSPFMPMFEVFRAELDEHHDRRERLIKQSRDVTASSKKIIFSLQRVRALKEDIPPKIATEIRARYSSIQELFISMSQDLQDVNAWRYQRQVSGGLQEYMEAVSFDHYLRTQSLITLEQASRTIPAGIELTGDDYVLGIFDLGGELMRFAITTMATTGSLPGSRNEGDSAEKRTILIDLRALRTHFEALDTASCGGTGLGKDMAKKLEVMQACVSKVEIAVCGMIVRGQERPKGWIPDLPEERAPW